MCYQPGVVACISANMKFSHLLVALATLRMSDWSQLNATAAISLIGSCTLFLTLFEAWLSSGFGPKPDDLHFLEIFAGLCDGTSIPFAEITCSIALQENTC